MHRTYTASTLANRAHTAGEATSSVDGGRLTNGSFALGEPVRVSLSRSAWAGPAFNETVDVTFPQHIGWPDPLQTSPSDGGRAGSAEQPVQTL